MESFPLDSHPELQKSVPAPLVLWCQGALTCLNTPFEGDKHFICPVWMQEAIKGGLLPQP